MSSDDVLVANELRVKGRYRDFMIRLPRGAPNYRPASLVLVLHGNQ